MIELLSCPVCKSGLEKSNGCLKCENGHSFDFAASDYVNLCLSNKMRESGDSREMIAARHLFLEKGYYSCLKDALANIIIETLPKQCIETVIIDAGCGEGYYTAGIINRLTGAHINATTIGLDISKAAIKTAAKRKTGTVFAVASVFDMPVRSQSANYIVSVFAPLCEDEFRRLLKSGGRLLIAGARQTAFIWPEKNPL